MPYPVWFVAEYIDRPESCVRLLIASGEMRPCEKSNPSGTLTVTETEVRRWMRKNGYVLSPETEEVVEPELPPLPPPPACAWIDRLVPAPSMVFDRVDSELFGALLARAFLRCGKEPCHCPRSCPGWLADKDCLEDDTECLYERARKEREG